MSRRKAVVQLKGSKAAYAGHSKNFPELKANSKFGIFWVIIVVSIILAITLIN